MVNEELIMITNGPQWIDCQVGKNVIASNHPYPGKFHIIFSICLIMYDGSSHPARNRISTFPA